MSQLVEMHIVEHSCHVLLMTFSMSTNYVFILVLFNVVACRYFQLHLMAKGHDRAPLLSSHMAVVCHLLILIFFFPGKTWTPMGSLCLICVHHQERQNQYLRFSLETTFYKCSEHEDHFIFCLLSSPSSFYTPAFFY